MFIWISYMCCGWPGDTQPVSLLSGDSRSSLDDRLDGKVTEELAVKYDTWPEQQRGEVTG